MKLDKFTRRIVDMNLRVERLRNAREAPSDTEPGTAAFEALDAAMEELQVALEELHSREDDLRSAQSAIEEERRQYRELFEFAPDGYLVTDLQGIIREANHGACDLLDFDRQFIVGKPLVVFVLEDGRPGFRSDLNRLKTSRTIAEYNLRLRPSRMAPFDAEVRVAVARDSQDKPVALRWTIRDVSGRQRIAEEVRSRNTKLGQRVIERSRQLESELQARERWLIKAHAGEARPERPLFHDLVQEADAILWTADAETGRYRFVSRRAEELLDFPTEDWVEAPTFWADRLHPEDREWAIGQRNRSFREGKDYEMEYRLLARDGRAVWFRESVRVLRDDEGRPREIYGLMVNISKRKKVERQLYQAKSDLAAQLDDLAYLNELILRLSGHHDLDALLGEVLASALAIEGGERGALLLFDPKRGALEPAAIIGLAEESLGVISRAPIARNAIERRKGVIVEDIASDPDFAPFREHDPAVDLRALHCVPLIARGGDVLGVVAVCFATPYRPSNRQVHLIEVYAKQAADFIESTRRRLENEDSDWRREEFLSLLAHELRNPIAAILRIIWQPSPEPATAEPALLPVRERIEQEARQLAQIVDDLFDAAGLRAGKVVLRAERIDLAQSIQHALASTQPVIETRQQTVSIRVPPEPVWVLADPARLEQVLLSVLAHAIRSTEPGGDVAISIDPREDEAELRIRDGGADLAAAALGHVFDPIFASSRRQASHGIGLWLARQLVERHGGSFTVSSQRPGTGSEYLIRLPLAVPEPSEPAGTVAPGSVKRSGGSGPSAP
jgi:PAS domain S-box-containing protein